MRLQKISGRISSFSTNPPAMTKSLRKENNYINRYCPNLRQITHPSDPIRVLQFGSGRFTKIEKKL